MSNTTTIKVGESAKTITLPEGKALILTGSVSAVGVAYLLDLVLGGTNSVRSWAIGAGALAAIGPYEGTQKILLTCAAGSIAAKTLEAVLTVQSGGGATKPAMPAAPVLTALTSAISVAYAVPADGGSAILEAQFTDINGVSTALTGSPQTIAKTAGAPITGAVRFRNAVGWSDYSPQSNSVTPATGVSTYTYKQLPAPSSVAANTQAIVSDWPGAPNRQMINNGVNWEPFPVAKVRQHINTRDGCGANNNSVASNGTQNSFNQAYGIKVSGAASAIKVLFSNHAKAVGGTTIVPGAQAMTIESSFTVGGTKSRNLWADAAVSKTLQPGEEVWADADASVVLAHGQIVSLNQHVVYPSVPSSIPCQNANGLMATTGEYVSYDAGARGVDLADLTMGTMPTGKIPQGAMQVPKAITGLTDYKPVVVVLGDSNRLWARQALQSAGIRWADFGMDGWTLQALATDDASTAFRFTHLAEMGVTHALVTMAGGDVTAGRTTAQIISYKNTVQAKFEALGIVPIFCTTPPKTTDDELAVIDTAKWTAIQGYNAEIRTNSKYGYIELFDLVGDRATGRWLPPSPSPLSTVGDGVHMTLTVHGMATAGVLPQLPALLKQG